jgi:mono/diheme cytochrome c family protein
MIRAKAALGLGLAALLAAAALAAVVLRPPAAASAHIADADDIPTVIHGRQLYVLRCATCHGRALQGQPLWQLIDENAGRRAPAQDETGHTWQHADEDIFHMIKYGRFAATPPQAHSFMPAFSTMLGDDEILAVMAFIKARWPLGLRVSQALLNPGYAGMPPGAERVAWRLPPTCNVLLQRQRAAARSAE